MIRQSERKSKEISQLPEAASNLVVYPELGLASAEFLQEMLGQKYIIASLPYGMQNLLQWLKKIALSLDCLLYTSPSPRDRQKSRMPSSA